VFDVDRASIFIMRSWNCQVDLVPKTYGFPHLIIKYEFHYELTQLLEKLLLLPSSAIGEGAQVGTSPVFGWIIPLPGSTEGTSEFSWS
jgi:hypothetical protein